MVIVENAYNPQNLDDPLLEQLQIPADELTQKDDDIVGSGGMGVVFRAEWRGRVVAIKKLHTQDHISPKDWLNFKNEVTLMYGLDNSKFVELLGIVTEPHQVGLVMEYFPNCSLANILLEPSIQLSWEHKARIAYNIAEAMVVLHSKEILHNDLKSSNVFVHNNWSIKIGDFGLAQTIAFINSNTDFANDDGTIAYLAPERFQGTLSKKTDVYSFAVVMWEIASRTIPFARQPNAAVREFVIHGGRLPLNPEWPEWYSTLIQQCWHQDPNSRPEFINIAIQLDKEEPLAWPILQDPAPVQVVSPQQVAVESIRTRYVQPDVQEAIYSFIKAFPEGDNQLKLIDDWATIRFKQRKNLIADNDSAAVRAKKLDDHRRVWSFIFQRIVRLWGMIDKDITVFAKSDFPTMPHIITFLQICEPMDEANFRINIGGSAADWEKSARPKVYTLIREFVAALGKTGELVQAGVQDPLKSREKK